MLISSFLAKWIAFFIYTKLLIIRILETPIYFLTDQPKFLANKLSYTSFL